MKKILLGTSDAWSMSPLSHRQNEPVYFIENCRILYFDRAIGSEPEGWGGGFLQIRYPYFNLEEVIINPTTLLIAPRIFRPSYGSVL